MLIKSLSITIFSQLKWLYAQCIDKGGEADDWIKGNYFF